MAFFPATTMAVDKNDVPNPLAKHELCMYHAYVR